MNTTVAASNCIISAARIEPAARHAADALANLLTEQLTDRGPWRHAG